MRSIVLKRAVWLLVAAGAIFLGLVAFSAWRPFAACGRVFDEPTGVFRESADPGSRTMPFNLLGTRLPQTVTATLGAGSHWISIGYEITDGNREIFDVRLSTHDDRGRGIWFCGTAPPYGILLYQPWVGEIWPVPEMRVHPVGYWKYEFDPGLHHYVGRPLMTNATFLWLQNPLGSLDL